ncbi:nicotinate-nucleotide--dimethylbenzimidazole phosphoribosyltransferase [Pseudoflavonifractor sp. MSJ-37]|uniref:nicotinate-nucleotide--dimethylbenzimidazole phosphoribosyltransferase n=1 Tax=Pseudoflavonifractor sp. MSJ-37 TaxID=2841531 RepID=UPI001C1020F3|nr:nicotinate-nucleotide--dimethylbenzimidazole phosphoribosyltransferase [Pseudoflavonifractor sp. MSJ-37]MBU5434726.1 nicotinate-nucleotide--dimethylbenzimidazole phosphoribosyltransferase [Pseudoflavonifractor sp. MSJ-37]
MELLERTISRIVPADHRAERLAQSRWDSIAKPLHSLGLLEDAVVRIAGMTGSPNIDLSHRAIVVMCADHGVVAQGVTQTGQEVTAIVTENMSKGDTSVCCMARTAHADLVPVDIGVARPVTGERILQRNLMRGTHDMTKGAAMDRAVCIEAIETGIRTAVDLCTSGVSLLGTGEMGIGNTTAASAVTAVLLGLDPEEVTGRGAGLSSEGLVRKVAAIRTALSVNAPDPQDPLDVLSKVGGLDLAGLAGVFLGAAVCRTPVLVDGFISAAAALCAVRLCPAAKDHLLASHVSAEPAGQRLLDELGLVPFLRAGMCLGEGTGAAAVMPLLDMALSVYREMATFDEIEVEAYQPLT